MSGLYLCVRRWRRSQWSWGQEKQWGVVLFLLPVAYLFAVNLISKEKYTLCLYKAGLCLWSELELSTILEIVSSLLKYFQTVTVEPVSFPANCLASFPISCLLQASSENKAFFLGLELQCWCWCCHLHGEQCTFDLSQLKHMCCIVSFYAPSSPHLVICTPLSPLWTVKIKVSFKDGVIFTLVAVDLTKLCSRDQLAFLWQGLSKGH